MKTGLFVAFVVFLLTVGSVVFHFVSPWWWTPIASNWGYIDDTIILTFWITGTVFVACCLFIAYCVLRYHHRRGRRAEYEPENKKLEWWLIGLTTAGVAGMLIPGVLVWDEFITVPEDATEIEVVAQQWQWSFRLPGEDGVMGTSNIEYISSENPLGVNPDDPNGQDDVVIEVDDLHLPLNNRPVKVLLRAIDVLHNFYVPQFRAKMDMVPGMITYFWFTPTRTGTFEILCAELCGIGHYAMRGYVVVEEESSYQLWLEEQSTVAELLAEARNDTGDDSNLILSEGKADPAERGFTP